MIFYGDLSTLNKCRTDLSREPWDVRVANKFAPTPRLCPRNHREHVSIRARGRSWKLNTVNPYCHVERRIKRNVNKHACPNISLDYRASHDEQLPVRNLESVSDVKSRHSTRSWLTIKLTQCAVARLGADYRIAFHRSTTRRVSGCLHCLVVPWLFAGGRAVCP